MAGHGTRRERSANAVLNLSDAGRLLREFKRRQDFSRLVPAFACQPIHVGSEGRQQHWCEKVGLMSFRVIEEEPATMAEISVSSTPTRDDRATVGIVSIEHRDRSASGPAMPTGFRGDLQ
jgi:hypothetical protein